MKFSILDLNNDQLRSAYESCFYECFTRIKKQKLLREIWNWNDKTKKITTKIPYKEQIIFCGQNNQGQLETAITACLSKTELQANIFGFTYPQNNKSKCEILTFFSVNDRSVANKMRLFEFGRGHLESLGIHEFYATCAPRLLGFYFRLKGELVAKTEIEGEHRFFICFDVKNPYIKSAKEDEKI